MREGVALRAADAADRQVGHARKADVLVHFLTLLPVPKELTHRTLTTLI